MDSRRYRAARRTFSYVDAHVPLREGSTAFFSIGFLAQQARSELGEDAKQENQHYKSPDR